MIPTFLYLSCSNLALCELNGFNLSLRICIIIHNISTSSYFYYHLLVLINTFYNLRFQSVNLVICSTSYDFWSFFKYGNLLSLAVI